MAPSIPIAAPTTFGHNRLADQVAGMAAGALTTSLLIAAAALASRRLVGGLTAPLPWPTLVGAIAAAALVASMARRLTELAAATHVESPLDQFTLWASGLALVVTGVALSLPGTGTPVLVVIWTITALEQGFEFWQSWRIKAARRKKLSAAKLPHPLTPVLPLPLTDVGAEDQSTANSALDSITPQAPTAAPAFYPLGPNVVQQFIRTQTADFDRMQGWLQTALAAGERNVTLHVAFCPPFDEAPRITLHQLSGPASRVKPVQILPFGMRLELKRTAIAKGQAAVIMQFTAEAPRAREQVVAAPNAE